MRRSEKAVTDADELFRIIDRCDFCRIGMCNNNIPYIVPVCFTRTGNSLFFHAAQEGLKTDLLRKNPQVCFQMDCEVSVVRNDNPCRWGVSYKSIIGTGNAVFLNDAAEKELILSAFMRKYGGKTETCTFNRDSIAATSIIRITITSLTGKQSGNS